MRPLTPPSPSAGTVARMQKTLEEMTLEELLDSLPLPPLDPNDPDPWMRRVALRASTTAPGTASALSTPDTQTEKMPDGSDAASTGPLIQD